MGGLIDLRVDAINKYNIDSIEGCSQNNLVQFKQYFTDHIGNMAILYTYNGNKLNIPKLVEIECASSRIENVRYKCYDVTGRFRCYLRCSVSYIDLLLGYVKLELFQDI